MKATRVAERTMEDFGEQWSRLNPAYAKYYREAEARGLSAGFQNVRLHHRHGYSWTVIGVKPGEVH